MVYLMQAVQRGKTSLLLAFVRQILLNLPAMILLNLFFGMNGMVWSATPMIRFEQGERNMATIYFVRHGQSIWNVEDKICGQTDSPLTEKGHDA